MKFTKKIIVSGILVAALISNPGVIFAQEVTTLPENNFQPGAGTMEAADNTFNWVDILWLIPLIAIPVLAYYVFVKRDESDELRSSDYVWQGTKGGRAKRDSGEMDDQIEKNEERENVDL